MLITSVDVFRVKVDAKDTGNCVSKLPWAPIVVRINTDEGICGYGEAGVCYGNGGQAAVGMIMDFAPLLVGKNPMNTEAIWEALFRDTFWGQGGGTIVSAGMSAIDIALWDIKGKALGVPVYQLLGGKTNSSLRTYASQIQFDWGPVTTPLIQPEQYAQAALKAVAEGYDCIKVDPLAYNTKGEWAEWRTEGWLTNEKFKLAVERLTAVREAIGKSVDIIVEMHCFSDTISAIQLGREFENLGIMMFEEPVTPLNPMLTKQVKDSVRIPIASGERIYTRYGYRPFFEMRALDMIQPDLGTAGGFTEGKKVCDMAAIYDVSVQCHVCGSPIATAAALQMEAAIPNFEIHEFHASALLDFNIKSCKYNYMPHNGKFDIPDLPGIGQELSEEALKCSECVTYK